MSNPLNLIPNIKIQIGQCWECKYWRDIYTNKEIGDCSKLTTNEINITGEDDIPTTNANFGCILWEKKQ